jgi:hypothetical protein
MSIDSFGNSSCKALSLYEKMLYCIMMLNKS